MVWRLDQSGAVTVGVGIEDADWRHGNLGMAKILLFFTQATANSPPVKITLQSGSRAIDKLL
jgi:hypothetical protein